MTYTLHYTSADGPEDGATWSVYSEKYETIEAAEPIEGTTILCAGGLVDEAEADRVARRLQVRSYSQPVSRNQ